MSVIIKDKRSLNEIVGENQRIVIWGAGKFGRELISEIERVQGNLEKVVAIIDNDEKKYKGNHINGIEVVSVDTVSKFLEPCTIIIAVKAYGEVLRQIDLISGFDGWDCYIYCLLKDGWDCTSREKIRYHKRINETILSQYAMNLKHKNVENSAELLEAKRKELQEEKKNIIAKMVFIVTNRCTLKCAGCLGRVPYIENPDDIDVDMVLRDMKLFLDCFDECVAVEIAGGEPLLYPHLDILLDFLIKQEKVLAIRFTTNGTFVPSEQVLRYMSNEKVWVGISDYGFLDKLARVVYNFEKYGVNFEVYSEMIWTDPGDLSKRNKTESTLKDEYENCWDAFNCKSIVNGRLFACPRYARLYLQNIHNFERDSISLLDYPEVEERRKAIYDLYLIDYAESCDYCEFGSKNRKLIEPGVQLNSAFHKSKYTLKKRENF